MKKKLASVLVAATMVLGTFSAFALDYEVPTDATTTTMRFEIQNAEYADYEFQMTSEDGSLTINITNDTIIYFPEELPIDDYSEETSIMARDLLFGRTLAEVLNNRNMRVIFTEGEENVAVSVLILFESISHGPLELTAEEIALFEASLAYVDEYYQTAEYTTEQGLAIYHPGYETAVAISDIVAIDAELNVNEVATLNGEVVVNGEILENAPHPFWQETEEGNFLMVPLRVVAEALGYDVHWNQDLQSIQLGVAIHLWPGNTEVHIGRMAPQEISTAPVIISGVTFVPIDFFRTATNQYAYWFEGQVVISTENEMM